MIKKCKNLRIRSKKGKLYGYCILLKKEVSIYCKCDAIEYKEQKTLKKATYSHFKKEKERFSIIYQDLTKCAECGSKIGHIDKNEVYEGSKRSVSMENGFVVPFCIKCHDRFHNDREFALKYKRMFQIAYEKKHSRQDFLNLIHRNYL